MFKRRRTQDDFNAEIEAHLHLETERLKEQGLGEEEARMAALRAFGNVTQAREHFYESGRWLLWDHFVHDVRFGLRQLRKNPGFTAAAVLALALGIGANTAIFSIVNAALLRPLPYPDSGRLVVVWATDEEKGVKQDVTSYPGFEDWKAQSRSFEGMAAFTRRGAIISWGEWSEFVQALQATPGFFETLRVAPAMGRTFLPGEEQPGAPHVAILSDAMWKEHFAGRGDVLGQVIHLNDAVYTIVGVMPAGLKVSPGRQEQIYTPLQRDPNRGHGFLTILARLCPGTTISQAQTEMDVITRRLAVQYPRTDRGVGANVMPLVKALVGDLRTGLLIFLGVVTLVLLIACANVANLMLTRGVSRRKEMSVRAALGAGRGRIVRQLLTESLLLSLAGGTLGLFLAHWVSRVVAAMLVKSFQLPRIGETSTDAWVFGFAFLVSLATGAVFGLAPAFSSSTPDLNRNLREAGHSAMGSIRGSRLRGVLVVAEMALALVLLAGAGLLLKSLLVMRKTAPGFDTRNLLAVDFSIPRGKLQTFTERSRFFTDLLARAESVPDVRSAALVADLPLGGGQDALGFHIPGRPDPQPGKPFHCDFNIASPGYFHTMDIPLAAGRDFDDKDSNGAPPAIIVSEVAAKRFWPGEDPIGKQITINSDPKTTITLTIVGEVKDVRQFGLGVTPAPMIYLNYAQPGPDWGWLVMVVRTAGDPGALKGTLKSVAAHADPRVPVLQVRSMDEILAASLAQPGVYTMLLGGFASLALLLAAVGLYGVVSSTATQRTHEIGIRAALGAARGDIARLVVRQGAVLAAAGIVLGLLGAAAFSRLLTNLIPSVRPGDPLTLAAVATLLLGVALAASLLPARRAMRVDPMIALRHE